MTLAKSATNSTDGGETLVYAELTMKQLIASRIAAILLLAPIFSISTLQAADTVAWSDLPREVGSQDREYSVLTKAGDTFRGRRLVFGPLGVRVTELGPWIPREQVTEVRIPRYKFWKDALSAPAGVLAGAAIFPNAAVLAVMAIPMVGITAASAPVVVVVEGVKRLLPARVIKVAP